MPPGPAHARQRRRRLLVLVSTLLLVSALSPRMQDTLVPEGGSRQGDLIIPESRFAARSSADGAVAERPAAAKRELFAFVPAPPDAEELEARAPVPGQDIRYVAINDALITGKNSVFWKAGQGVRLTVPLPDGRQIEVELEHTEALGPDQFTSTGHIVGVPEGRAIFSYYQGRLSARFENLPEGDFQLRPMTDPHGQKVNQFYAIDATLIPNCGDAPETELGNEAGLMVVETTPEKGSGRMPVIGSDVIEEETPVEALVSGQAIVDVLMVYTRAVREALGVESVMAEIGLGLAKVNSDFANSGITARVRLAGTLEVEYADDLVDSPAPANYQSTVLGRLQNARDGFLDTVHTKRDEVGADLVCLLVHRSETAGGSSGVAYILTDPHSYVGTFFGFSVVHSSLVSGAGSVLSHELGHNFGCAHARNDPGATGTTDGAYAHSYGYRFTAVDTTGRARELRTIMAYQPGSRVPYFSNPRLTLPSLTTGGSTFLFNPEPALGVAEGASAADNARTIEQNAFQVASYRISRDYSGAGKLVNVSTRAHVGVGAEGMFGGFVITGSGTKRVLIRAVGPTLAAFGVPGVLADPTLQVVNGARTFERTNDDWWQGDTAGELAQANRTATGFALPAGSRDAALLLSLPPGDYSAVVAGKAGRTGQAMVEAYEIDAGQSRLINISTRAYGSSDRPIFAGFVVEAEPKQPNRRKRMLIRVRGPSLEDYGLAANTLMRDPVLQLYDAGGRLILENDDWDPPTFAANGSATPMARRGEVDQASEQAVYDAVQAVAPGNMLPTEPAVVVELPPGLYSTIVRPFEELPDQPAVPGIAVVEVYELPGSAGPTAD